VGLQEFFYMPQNLATSDLPALLPIREEGVLRIFIALKNPSPWPGFETATFGSSGQHTSHYTTKATRPYTSVVILPLLVDHHEKVGELVLSITSCPSIIVLENTLN
jgi:hypothetical protein